MGQGELQIPSLDGLRATAIVIVLATNAVAGAVVPGGFGMTIFFMLSGYLVATVLRREHAISGRIEFRRFLQRRALRVMPAVLVVLLIAIVLDLLEITRGTGTGVTLLGTVGQLGFLTNYLQIGSSSGVAAGTEVLWSLALGAQVFVALPLFLTWILRRPTTEGRAKTLALACGAIAVWRLLLVASLDVSTERIGFGTDTRLDAILFGVLLAIAANPIDPTLPSLPGWLEPVGLAAAAVALLTVWSIDATSFHNTVGPTLQAAALLPVFFFAIRHADRGPYRLLNTPAARFLGSLSFSLYLVHLTVHRGIETTFPSLPTALVVVFGAAASLVYAHTVLVRVEQPIEAMRRRLDHGRSQSSLNSSGSRPIRVG